MITAETPLVVVDSTFTIPSISLTASSMGMVTFSSMDSASSPGLKASTTVWGNSIEGMSSRLNWVKATTPATNTRTVIAMVAHLKRNDARVNLSINDLSIVDVISLKIYFRNKTHFYPSNVWISFRCLRNFLLRWRILW